MKSIDKIRNWVSVRTSFYFFLPDGDYGRPFDNQYKIESVDLADNRITIKFYSGLALYFTGEPEVVDEACNLLIKKYQKCFFKENNQQLKVFDHGEVVLNGF